MKTDKIKEIRTSNKSYYNKFKIKIQNTFKIHSKYTQNNENSK